MRLFMYVLYAACLLLSSYSANCETAGGQALYYLSANTDTSDQPEYVTGLFLYSSAKTAFIDKTTNTSVPVIPLMPAPLKSATDTAAKPITETANQQLIINPVDNSVRGAGLEELPYTFEEEVPTVITKYADLISVEPHEIDNYPLYRFINQWYGIRYKWGGTDSSGIDCSAFSQKLYHKVYDLDLVRTSRQQHKKCEHIKNADEATEGDLVFFKMHRLLISHVGVYLANGYFVHASRSKGVMISNINDKYWHRRFAGCGRIEKQDEAKSESDAQ